MDEKFKTCDLTVPFFLNNSRYKCMRLDLLSFQLLFITKFIWDAHDVITESC